MIQLKSKKLRMFSKREKQPIREMHWSEWHAIGRLRIGASRGAGERFKFPSSALGAPSAANGAPLNLGSGSGFGGSNSIGFH